MNEHGYCPNCKIDLDGDLIWNYFFVRTQSEEEATKISAVYGATKERGKWNKTIAIYDTRTDRTESYKCPSCSHEWVRT